ncbi:MAG TPA: EamA family transporter [Candidatus Cybelea sp.]|nr:EamA family transporter [Candidatus Cybelea sp.]
MTPWLALLFLVSVVCDVSGQFCFKRGADGIEHVGRGSKLAAFLGGLLQARWLWLGIGIYAVELVVWLSILARVPLSLAYPLNSLNYCGVLIASRLFLRERIPLRRWLGAGIITVGVAIVGVAA